MIHAKVIVMKISKSKRQLAQLLIDAGVKEFPNGADWAAQGSTDLKASFYSGYKPNRGFGEDAFCGNYCGRCHDVQLPSLINNWYQTVLSCDEFDQIVAEIVADAVRDADGWIEWKGGECPVDVDALVCCKWRSWKVMIAAYRAGNLSWRHNGNAADIIAYRLHKPEQVETVEYNYPGVVYTGPVQSSPQFCESVMRSIPEYEIHSKNIDITKVDDIDVVESRPTLDQLLQDWRNADDYAQRKQAEADETAAMRDERWQAVQARAGEVGVTVGLCESVAAEPEQVKPVKPVMTGKFRNAKIGSPDHYISRKGWSDEICDECGKRFWAHFDTNCHSQ